MRKNTFVCTVHPFTHAWACCSRVFSMPLLLQAPWCGILRHSSSNYHMLLIMQNCQQFVFYGVRKPSASSHTLPFSVICSENVIAWILGFLLTLARASQLPAYQHPQTQVPSSELGGLVWKAGRQSSVCTFVTVTAVHMTASSSGSIALGLCMGHSLGCCWVGHLHPSCLSPAAMLGGHAYFACPVISPYFFFPEGDPFPG